MLRRLFLTGGCTMLALVALARSLDPVTLAWKPKVGDVHHYNYKSTVDNVQGQAMSVSNEMTETIKSIGDKGNVDLAQVTDHMLVLYGGNDITSTAGIPPSITTSFTNGPDGHVITQHTDFPMADSPRTDNIGQFVMPDHPVNAGDSWTYSGKGIPSKPTYDYTITYTYKGTDTVDSVLSNKVDVAFKEVNVPAGTDPITGTGTCWLSPSDGSLVKSDVKIQNAPLGPTLGSSSVSVSIDLKAS